jgi:hypothetical protein
MSGNQTDMDDSSGLPFVAEVSARTHLRATTEVILTGRPVVTSGKDYGAETRRFPIRRRGRDASPGVATEDGSAMRA